MKTIEEVGLARGLFFLFIDCWLREVTSMILQDLMENFASSRALLVRKLGCSVTRALVIVCNGRRKYKVERATLPLSLHYWLLVHELIELRGERLLECFSCSCMALRSTAVVLAGYGLTVVGSGFTLFEFAQKSTALLSRIQNEVTPIRIVR